VWRVRFVIGGVFGFIAMLLRRWLEETPVFEDIQRRAALSEELPLRVILRRQRRAIAASVISTWILTATIVVNFQIKCDWRFQIKCDCIEIQAIS
jgi:hypothetical protein